MDLVPNTIHLVFLKLTVNLFWLHQVAKFVSCISKLSRAIIGDLFEDNRDVSSANRKISLFPPICLMSLTYIRKNKGPKIEPCGTPHLMSLLVDLFRFLLVKKFSDHFNNLVLIPIQSNFFTNILWSTVSNAFLRSTKATRVISLLFIALKIKSDILPTVSIVDLLGLKPPWLQSNKLLVSKNCSICWWIIFSSSLPGSGRRDTGLRLLTSDLSPSFCNGITVASFHASGNFPLLRDKLNSLVSLSQCYKDVFYDFTR